MPIRADSACTERWESFEPRCGGRHCGTCDVTVADLTRVTRRRAEALVMAAGGRMCARLRIDARGEPVFRPEPGPARSALGAAALGLLAAACEAPGTAAGASPPALVDGELSAPPGAHLLGIDGPARFGGSLVTSERAPMRPLGGGSSAASIGSDRPAEAHVAAPAEEEAASPTAEQMLLTEAKEREERAVGARPRRRPRVATAGAAPGTVVHPLPPLGTGAGNVAPPAVHLFLGGISYVP